MYVKVVPCKLHTEKLLLFKLYNGYRIRRVLCRHSLGREHGSICIASGRRKWESLRIVGNLSPGNKNKWMEMHTNKLFVHMLVIRNNGYVHLTLAWTERESAIRKQIARDICPDRWFDAKSWRVLMKSTFKVIGLYLSFFSVLLFFLCNISYVAISILLDTPTPVELEMLIKHVHSTFMYAYA